MTTNNGSIGIAGIGKMGAAIAARLVETGADVRVWNRSLEKARATGLNVVSTPRALAEQCDFVLTILFDATAIEEVYKGPDGLIAGGFGKLFVEMSTVEPKVHEALSSAVTRSGGSFLECAVGGTTGPARSGQLLGLAGGNNIDLERARPLLSNLCRRIVLMGPVGAGAAAKLAINLPLIVFWQAFGEAMSFVEDLAKDPDWLVKLFTQTVWGADDLKTSVS